MNIAIYFGGDSPLAGGVFTHQAALLDIIRDYADAPFEFTLVCSSKGTYEACHGVTGRVPALGPDRQVGVFHGEKSVCAEARPPCAKPLG